MPGSQARVPNVSWLLSIVNPDYKHVASCHFKLGLSHYQNHIRDPKKDLLNPSSPPMCEWQNVKYEACGHEAKVPSYCKNAPVISKKFMLSGIHPFSAWGHQTCSDWELHQSLANQKHTPFKAGKCMACRRWTEEAEAVPRVYPSSCVQ